MKRRYQPSETHVALHPARELLTCSDCKVKFAARPTTDHDEDDPGKCLTCNRSSWSKLFSGGNDEKIVTATQSDTALEFNLVSDDDVGEVVKMSVRRPRK